MLQLAVITALVAFCHAGLIDEGQSHAVSSQNIVRHDEPTHQTTAHFTPVLQHPTTLFEHAPIVHSAPILEQTSFVHATPYVQHVGPAIHHGPVVSSLSVNQADHAEEHVSTLKIYPYYLQNTFLQ